MGLKGQIRMLGNNHNHINPVVARCHRKLLLFCLIATATKTTYVGRPLITESQFEIMIFQLGL